MDVAAPFKRLREHQVWARKRLIAGCHDLPMEQLQKSFPIGTGNVWDTVVHLYAAEYVWLQAINGDPSPRSPWDIKFDGWDELLAAWDALDQDWNTFIQNLNEAKLDSTVTKVSTSSFAGGKIETKCSDVLMHIALHAQYTTAQAVNMLRHLGVETLPETMLITLARQQASENG